MGVLGFVVSRYDIASIPSSRYIATVLISHCIDTAHCIAHWYYHCIDTAHWYSNWQYYCIILGSNISSIHEVHLGSLQSASQGVCWHWAVHMVHKSMRARSFQREQFVQYFLPVLKEVVTPANCGQQVQLDTVC